MMLKLAEEGLDDESLAEDKFDGGEDFPPDRAYVAPFSFLCFRYPVASVIVHVCCQSDSKGIAKKF